MKLPWIKPSAIPAVAPSHKSVILEMQKASASLKDISEDYVDGGKTLASAAQEGTYHTSELIYSCVDYIAKSAGQCSFKIGTRTVGNLNELTPLKDKEGQKFAVLFDTSPNPDQTWAEWINLMVQSQLLGGNGYSSVEKVGKTYELWPQIPPSKMVIQPDNKNYIKEYIYNEKVTYKKDEMMHFKNVTINNEFYGISTVQAIVDTLKLEAAGIKDLTQYYENSGIPAAVLESEYGLTPDQMTTLRQQFEDVYHLDRKRHSTLVLPNGSKFRPIQANPQELQLLESLTISADRVFRQFNLNPIVLGGGDSIQFTTYVEKVVKLVFNTAVRPILYAMADKMSLYFQVKLQDPTITVECDFDRIPEIGTSMSEKAESAKTLFSTGIMSLNESRDEVGLPRLNVPAADFHFLPSYLMGSNVQTIETFDPTTDTGDGTGDSAEGDSTGEGSEQPTGSTDPQGGANDLADTQPAASDSNNQ